MSTKKSKIPFEFGQRIRVKAILIRATLTNSDFPTKKSRSWQSHQLPEPLEGIYLKYVTLYDGDIDHNSWDDEDGGGYYEYLKITKTHPSAWICIKGKKPEKVFLEDIEAIND